MARVEAGVDRYAREFSLVVAREHYEQRAAQAGRERVVEVRLESEFALVRLPGSALWTGYRDVLRHNGAPVHDRVRRLQDLLADPPADAVQQARQIADESARFNVGPLHRNFNNPTTALELLDARNRSRLRFEREGEATVEGLRVWIVRFRERSGPTIIRTPQGRSLPAEGRAWIDPATGVIVRTELTLRDFAPRPSGGGRATITVAFRREERFDLWVPAELTERYETDDLLVTGQATYSDYRRFETSARVKAP